MEFTTRQKQQKRTRKREDLRVVTAEFVPTPGAEKGLGKVYDLLFRAAGAKGEDHPTEE